MIGSGSERNHQKVVILSSSGERVSKVLGTFVEVEGSGGAIKVRRTDAKRCKGE